MLCSPAAHGAHDTTRRTGMCQTTAQATRRELLERLARNDRVALAAAPPRRRAAGFAFAVDARRRAPMRAAFDARSCARHRGTVLRCSRDSQDGSKHEPSECERRVAARKRPDGPLRARRHASAGGGVGRAREQSNDPIESERPTNNEPTNQNERRRARPLHRPARAPARCGAARPRSRPTRHPGSLACGCRGDDARRREIRRPLLASPRSRIRSRVSRTQEALPPFATTTPSNRRSATRRPREREIHAPRAARAPRVRGGVRRGRILARGDDGRRVVARDAPVRDSDTACARGASGGRTSSHPVPTAIG